MNNIALIGIGIGCGIGIFMWLRHRGYIKSNRKAKTVSGATSTTPAPARPAVARATNGHSHGHHGPVLKKGFPWWVQMLFFVIVFGGGYLIVTRVIAKMDRTEERADERARYLKFLLTQTPQQPVQVVKQPVRYSEDDGKIQNPLAGFSLRKERRELFTFDSTRQFTVKLGGNWRVYPKGGKIKIKLPDGRIEDDYPGVDKDLGCPPDGEVTFYADSPQTTGVEIHHRGKIKLKGRDY